MAEEEEQELPQQVQDLAEASVPNSIREIRACKRCGILKTFDQFVSDGMCSKRESRRRRCTCEEFMTRSSSSLPASCRKIHRFIFRWQRWPFLGRKCLNASDDSGLSLLLSTLLQSLSHLSFCLFMSLPTTYIWLSWTFYRQIIIGCENCPFLYMIDNEAQVNRCTSAFYEGQVALMDPRESWAAKWIRVDKCLPGVYALSITGNFDKEIEEDLEARGIRWRCRPA